MEAKEWTADQERYLADILSVSVIPDFFRRYLPIEMDHCDIAFIACGPGYEIRSIDRAFPDYFRGKNVILTDYSTRFLEDARANAAGVLEQFDVRKCCMSSLDIEDESLDVVMCINGLLYEELIPKALDEARRVLRKGGLFIANTYPPYEHMDGANIAELEEFREFEKELGLKYVPPPDGGNGYFIMHDESLGADQVLISDKNMIGMIQQSGLELRRFERYSIPTDLVSRVRKFPLDKLVEGGHDYQTSVWVMKKG